MENITNFEIKEDYSITSTKLNIMPLFLPNSNKKDTTGIIFNKTEEEITELKTSRIYKKDDFEYRMSLIPMNVKTDETILLALLSENKEEFSISIKDLAIKIGVTKRNAGTRAVKDRIMNSINKMRTFDFTVLENDIYHTGFSILSYSFDMPEKDHLTIYFDKQFLNLYRTSNNCLINYKKYLSLKNEYSKLMYSMLNNYFEMDQYYQVKETTIFKEVIRKRLNSVDEEGNIIKLSSQQRQKINKALKELKDNAILKSYRFNKNDSLVFTINTNIIKKPKPLNKENNMEKSTILEQIEKLTTQKQFTKSVVELEAIKENIKNLEAMLYPQQPEEQIIEPQPETIDEQKKANNDKFEEEMLNEFEERFGTRDIDEVFEILQQPQKIKIIKK